jgi:hypothetical protein
MLLASISAGLTELVSDISTFFHAIQQFVCGVVLTLAALKLVKFLKQEAEDSRRYREWEKNKFLD